MVVLTLHKKECVDTGFFYVGKQATNRQLNPFPLPEDKFVFPFSFFWCVAFDVTNVPETREQKEATRRLVTILSYFLSSYFHLSFKLNAD